MRPSFHAAAMVLTAAAPAAADQLMVAPTTLAIEPQRYATMMTVENGSDRPVDIQVRAYDWTQPDGRDTLAPTADLVVSPAIATVPPHARQVFRVLLAAGTATAVEERAWRLRVNQLPRDDQQGIGVNLEFLVPLFRGPMGAMPRLAWGTAPDGRVTLTNTGARRTRLTRLVLDDATGSVEVPGAASTYLLAGATRTFARPAAVPAGARLVAIGDTGPVDATPTLLAAR